VHPVVLWCSPAARSPSLAFALFLGWLPRVCVPCLCGFRFPSNPEGCWDWWGYTGASPLPVHPRRPLTPSPIPRPPPLRPWLVVRHCGAWLSPSSACFSRRHQLQQQERCAGQVRGGYDHAHDWRVAPVDCLDPLPLSPSSPPPPPTAASPLPLWRAALVPPILQAFLSKN
jgi:hypothetical protein